MHVYIYMYIYTHTYINTYIHKQMLQRQIIKEETQGQYTEPVPEFAPKGYSITVALATRDNRDPNRYICQSPLVGHLCTKACACLF